jgi:hypothetical protein
MSVPIWKFYLPIDISKPTCVTPACIWVPRAQWELAVKENIELRAQIAGLELEIQKLISEKPVDLR